MSEWISVEDRLPEDEQTVLLYAKNPYGADDVFIGYRGQMRLWDGTFSPHEWIAKTPMSSSGYVIDERGNAYMKPRKVTHWMPLPAPPKGDD